MIETGFSTILSVGCLCLVPSYLVWVYFKTTLLVVALGLFHGLLVLPTFLAWLSMDVWEWIYRSGDQSTTENGHNAKNGVVLKIADPDIVQISMKDVDVVV